MCHYRYYYFAACQHQQTVLYNFCERAIAPPTVAAHIDGDSVTVPLSSPLWSREEVSNCDEAVAVTGNGVGDVLDSALPPLLPPPPSPSSTSSTRRTRTSSCSVTSSVPASFASISESVSDTASIHEQRLPSLRHSEAAQRIAMATSSPLGLKHWFGGSSPKPGSTVITSNHEACGEITRGPSKQAQSLRSRRDGIRQATDESCSLPDSGEILRHIAASCQGNFEPQHTNTETGSTSSQVTEIFHRSANNPFENTCESYDAIESEIDVLRGEVHRLRDRALRDQAAPRHDVGPGVESALSEGVSCHSTVGASNPIPESAAARLQRAHEQAQQESTMSSIKGESDPAPLPVQSDFPKLGLSQKATKTAFDKRDVRKPSYRDMVSTGLGISTTSVATNDSGEGEGKTDGGGMDMSPTTLCEDHIVVQTPTVPKCSFKSPSTRSPRFAQPTKSFARRTDETLRKDGTASPFKVTPEGSPNKSTSAAEQRQQKRRSLPTGWMSGASNLSPSSVAASKDDRPSEPADSHISPKQVQHKKATSYMSPTQATTRRSIATLGEDTTVRSPTKARLATLAKIDTASASPDEIKTPSPSIITSADTIVSSDSYTIITDFRIGQGARRLPLQETFNGADIVAVGSEAGVESRMRENGRQAAYRLPRRSTVGSPIADLLAVKTRAAGMPEVANTTPKRRGSHGHILLPIVNRLARFGLLHIDGTHPASSLDRGQSSPLKVSMQAFGNGSFKPSYGSSTPDTGEVTGTTLLGAVSLPPHRRRQQNSSAETFASATRTSFNAPVHVDQVAQSPSLNAAAKEFKPMPKVQSVEEQLRSGNLEALVAYKSENEWHDMSPQQRRVIQALREHQVGENKNHKWNASMPSISPSTSASKTLDQQLWFNATVQPAPVSRNHLSPEQDPFNNEYPGVRAGQVLKPRVDARSNAVKWYLQHTDGTEASLNFGRAAQPSQTPQKSPTTRHPANIVASQGAPGSWIIAPARKDTGSYGWSGGDGREVKFTGWGPDAERDPNTPIDFNFHGRKTTIDQGPRMVGSGNGDNSCPLAPRSRQQWAERLGYPKVPCGEINIAQAVEFPVASHAFTTQLAGYCFDRACSFAVR